jgi:hypothetical protein
MGSSHSAPARKKPALNRAGNYTAKYLHERWAGTERDGYRYHVSYAPTGRATCAACKKAIAQGAVRVGRSMPNPFDAEGGASDYTKFFHLPHAFEAMARSRCASKVVLTPGALKGIDRLSPSDQKKVRDAIAAFAKRWRAKCPEGGRS